MEVFLNGTELARNVNQLPEDSIRQLKYVGKIGGIEVFENPELPEGTLTFENKGVLLAIIRGLGKAQKF